MWRQIVAGSLLLAAFVAPAFADEKIRRVQEALRKRILYFGNVDGKRSDALTRALQKYQARKGFAASGEIDEETAGSLNVTDEPKPSGGATPRISWPDVTVLRSDTARLAPPDSPAPAAEATPAAIAQASPETSAPAEPPAETQNASPERVQKFVENYLRDAELNDIEAQTKYYAGAVSYFDHGRVGLPFVEKDTRNYCRRWPQRKYRMIGPPALSPGPADGETAVKFRIAFQVENKTNSVAGMTDNFWTIKPLGETFRIVAIREERVRE